MIFLSLIYDILWFIVNNDVEDDDDGGVERGVKRFARNISYISFVWKVSENSLQKISLLQFLQISNHFYTFRSSLPLSSGKILWTILQLWSRPRPRHHSQTEKNNVEKSWDSSTMRMLIFSSSHSSIRSLWKINSSYHRHQLNSE